jgi:Hint domain
MVTHPDHPDHPDHHKHHQHHHHHHHHHQVCFMADTLIQTPDGKTPVQELKIGDRVLTREGQSVPVRWIGRQTIASQFMDELHKPIRVKAGAFQDNVPCRDLVVSPAHALLVDDVLIQAGALVNDVSIVREHDVPDVFSYYHIEVDDHSLILAENTPAETFVDNVDRANFDNWDEYLALYPEGKAVIEMPYPRAKAYRQVPRATRERLFERGFALYGARVASVA